MPSGIHTRAFGSGGGSPVANGVQTWQTNGAMLQLDSPRVDWWWWRDRRWLQRAATARSRRRARCGSGSGEGESNARQQAAVGASLGPSGDAGLLGRRWKLAEGGARRAAAAMVGDGRRAHVQELRWRLFIAGRAQRRPCFAVKRPCVLMHGTMAVSACVHDGEGTTPRRVRTRRVARGSTGRGGFYWRARLPT
jgi:hypothetical protein